MVVPSQIPREPIGDVRGSRELVELVRVDDEFGFPPEGLERLIHLLAPEDGDVPIHIAAHEESGRGDVLNLIKWG